jgi:hypothetical protein
LRTFARRTDGAIVSAAREQDQHGDGGPESFGVGPCNQPGVWILGCDLRPAVGVPAGPPSW